MELLLIITSFSFTLYTWKSKYFHKSALFIFNLLWFIIFFCYYFRFLGFYSAREGTFLMYLYGIISFFIGYVFLNCIWKCRNSNIKIDKYEKWKKKAVAILTILSIFIYFQKCILAIPLWLSGGLGEVKHSSIIDSALNLGGIWDILFVYVAKPMHVTLILYAVISLFQGDKNKLLYLATGVLIVFGYIGTGSRFSIVEILLFAFAYIFLFTSMGIKQLANRYRILSITIFLIAVIILVSMASGGDMLGSLYCYLCGCMPCSDNAILRLDESVHYYGLVSFNGVFRVLNQIPSMLGLTPGVKTILDVAYEYMIRFEETTYIGYGIQYNAFVSMFTYFYADAGYAGVCFFSFLFGAVTSIINKRAFVLPSYSTCALLLYIIMMIFNSMVRVQTFLVPSVMSVVYIMLIIPYNGIAIETRSKRTIKNSLFPR